MRDNRLTAKGIEDIDAPPATADNGSAVWRGVDDPRELVLVEWREGAVGVLLSRELRRVPRQDEPVPLKRLFGLTCAPRLSG